MKCKMVIDVPFSPVKQAEEEYGVYDIYVNPEWLARKWFMEKMDGLKSFLGYKVFNITCTSVRLPKNVLRPKRTHKEKKLDDKLMHEWAKMFETDGE